jgi:5'-nucleotidase
MKILLTNDDGPSAPGLGALRRALAELGEVTVVCPAGERSGVAHAITYLRPVRAAEASLSDGTLARTLSGTPADCVKFALLQLFDSPPDLVVSGPNQGVNAGVALFYSGTVGAAIEGAINGVPSVAFSTSRSNADQMDRVARQAVRVLDHLRQWAEHEPWLFNVNIPHLDGSDPELCLTRQCISLPRGDYNRRPDSAERDQFRLDWTVYAEEPPPDSDLAVLERGAISVTPLRQDLTDAALLAELEKRRACNAKEM